MKRKLKSIIATLVAAVFGVFLGAPGVSAANPYGIQYSGGEELGASNLQVAPEKVTGLTELVRGSADGSNVIFASSTKWEQGYQFIYNKCYPVHYFRVWDGFSMSPTDVLSYAVTNGKYTETVSIQNIVLDGLTNVTEDNAMAVIVEGDGAISARRAIYSDSTCQTAVSNVKSWGPAAANSGKLFVQANIRIVENAKLAVFTSDELYFAFNDVDAAQSYKILNADSLLTKNNMFVKNAEAFQSPDFTYKNMYSASGNYIYSQFDPSLDPVAMNLQNDDNVIFIKLGTATQTEGLNVVFGFAAQAGSNVMFYTQQYQVVYTSDDYGEITGLKDEIVVAGKNPTGSEQKPNEDYIFSHWIADVDVTLKDGTKIKAGDEITSEQILDVVVDKNIKFTAIHVTESDIVVPNTGVFTGSNNAALTTMLLAPVVLIIVLAIYGYNRKKIVVKFDKNKAVIEEK